MDKHQLGPPEFGHGATRLGCRRVRGAGQPRPHAMARGWSAVAHRGPVRAKAMRRGRSPWAVWIMAICGVAHAWSMTPHSARSVRCRGADHSGRGRCPDGLRGGCLGGPRRVWRVSRRPACSAEKSNAVAGAMSASMPHGTRGWASGLAARNCLPVASSSGLLDAGATSSAWNSCAGKRGGSAESVDRRRVWAGCLPPAVSMPARTRGGAGELAARSVFTDGEFGLVPAPRPGRAELCAGKRGGRAERVDRRRIEVGALAPAASKPARSAWGVCELAARNVFAGGGVRGGC